MLTEQELTEIHWRATRGCHYEGAIICTSKYGIQVIEEDVPRLLVEYRQLVEEKDEWERKSKNNGLAAAIGLERMQELQNKYEKALETLRRISEYPLHTAPGTYIDSGRELISLAERFLEHA